MAVKYCRHFHTPGFTESVFMTYSVCCENPPKNHLLLMDIFYLVP